MKQCLLFLFLASAVSAENFYVRVVSVHDADTIVVSREGRAKTVRLKGIDCPEGSGSRATKYAKQAIEGKNVLLKTYGTDKYGRTIADLFLENGKLFNLELVRTGHCRWGRSRALRE